MADDGDLHKLHGLLEAMLGEQVHLGQSLDRHLQNVQGGRLEENGHLSEDEKMQSILRHLQGVETEGSKLKHDLQILTASQHGQNLTEAYDEQLERLKEDVSRMAHTQQETETHLTELGHVLSACLAGLEQRSPVPSGPAVGPQLAAEVEAAHKALQEERDRNAELTQTIASLQQAAEEGKQTKSTLEKALADGADEAKRAITARLKLQAELDEAERSLKKERKLATKAKKRHDEENKKNMATFKELRKEQFGQLAALEDQILGLQQELAGEKARSQGVQEQVGEARLAYEQKERELQEMLRIAREEASAQESALARANTRESEMETRLAELEAQLARRSEEQEAVSTSAAAAQRSDEDREARLREREEEMRTATEEWERERGERNARVEVLTEQLARANEELAQLKAILAEGEERARLAEERTAVAERTLATATAEWTERQGQAERLYAEQGTALAELGVRLAAFEERLPEIENRAVRRGRDEVQGNLDRLQAEHALLSSQLKQAEKEARAYKAEAEALRNELAQASQKPAGAALASHPGVQTRRKLEPEMRAAASSPAAASADHGTRKVRRRSEPDKEQDITDLLQSDDVVQTRPRTMPATTSGQSLPAATGGTSASADHRTDPVEYLSEELVLYMFSRLSARDLLSLARVNRKYRRIASDASLWRPKCLRLWHFQESEGSAYTDTDWKEVYIYRHTHYKQVSCVVVGDENVGKKTLITAFEGMVTQKGWKRGQERERCTVCVESLFGVPTMFHLTVLKANPPDPCSDLMHHLADLLTRTKVDVFLLCVPASGSVEATKSRLDALESKVLPALEALCPDVPRILVGTETDIKEEHYDHSHPTAISMSFSNFVERHHCHAAVLTSAMSNRNLVELFDMAQSLVATPNLRLKVSHDQVVVMNQTIRSKERKPPRSTALGPRASTQYGYPDAVASLPTPLQTSPSSPRRQGGTPARGAASPYVAPATPSPSTPYTPYSASSSLFTPSSSTPADGPPLSPYLYNQPVSQSTPLPSTTGTPLASAASAGTTTPGSTTRNWRRLRSSASDTPRSQRDNKCALQ